MRQPLSHSATLLQWLRAATQPLSHSATLSDWVAEWLPQPLCTSHSATQPLWSRVPEAATQPLSHSEWLSGWAAAAFVPAQWIQWIGVQDYTTQTYFFFLGVSFELINCYKLRYESYKRLCVNCCKSQKPCFFQFFNLFFCWCKHSFCVFVFFTDGMYKVVLSARKFWRIFRVSVGHVRIFFLISVSPER